MAEHSLQGIRAAILLADNFEQVEMTQPRQVLEQAGAETVLISPVSGQVQGMNHDVQADRFAVDLPLEQANPDDFDALLLPGGALNADFLRVNPQAQAFVRRINEQNRPIAVICHGSWLLVSAGLVGDRVLTSYHTIQDDIRNAGGHWRDQEVVRDRNWVSSRSPQDLPAFCEAMVNLFAESQSQNRRLQTA